MARGTVGHEKTELTRNCCGDIQWNLDITKCQGTGIMYS